MALTINDILGRNLFPGLELRAGAEFSSNIVSWVNIMEILDTTESVKAGELLITTGYGLDDSASYTNLIRRLKDRGTAGIMIQPGYYIDQIPAYILKDADLLGLPVLYIPPDYSFSDLLHTLISEIASDTGSLPFSGFDTDRFLKALTSRLNAETGLGFTRRNSGCLVCITPVNSSAMNALQINEAVRRLSSLLCGRMEQSVPEIRPGGQACILFLSDDSRALNSLLYDLQAMITSISEESGINLYAGAERAGSERDLPQAMQKALQCISLLRLIGAKRGSCSYEDYNFVSNHGIVYRSCRGRLSQDQSLERLLSRDRTKKTEYVDTLRVFLTENGNTSRAAERLFIHRHTLLNRLESIREICGIDLKNYYTRMSLSEALLMFDFYGS
ncbi:MAG: PucR family transcriptional regulator ligand-binding domain-containing protein [Stomatobaculum sp.]|nr:PucR family transcriptional regulator ligand-binding domain-containing protein [Stomatobaculum sp.]